MCIIIIVRISIIKWNILIYLSLSSWATSCSNLCRDLQPASSIVAANFSVLVVDNFFTSLDIQSGGIKLQSERALLSVLVSWSARLICQFGGVHIVCNYLFVRIWLTNNCSLGVGSIKILLRSVLLFHCILSWLGISCLLQLLEEGVWISGHHLLLQLLDDVMLLPDLGELVFHHLIGRHPLQDVIVRRFLAWFILFCSATCLRDSWIIKRLRVGHWAHIHSRGSMGNHLVNTLLNCSVVELGEVI